MDLMLGASVLVIGFLLGERFNALVGARWLRRERAFWTLEQTKLLNRIQDPISEVSRSHEERDHEELPRIDNEYRERTMAAAAAQAARIDAELERRGIPLPE